MNQTAIRENALRTIARGQIGYKELIRQVGATKPELDAVLTGLRSEGLILSTTTGYRLAPKRVPDSEIDMRDDEPAAPPAPPTSTTPAPPEAAILLAAPPEPEKPALRVSLRCSKCRKPKGEHEMYRRDGKLLATCKACYRAAIREGHQRRKEAAQAETRKDLAQVVKKHTKKLPKGPLQVRHLREVTADMNELDVIIEVREDTDAAGSVTLTYSEAVQLRDWLNAQDIG